MGKRKQSISEQQTQIRKAGKAASKGMVLVARRGGKTHSCMILTAVRCQDPNAPIESGDKCTTRFDYFLAAHGLGGKHDLGGKIGKGKEREMQERDRQGILVRSVYSVGQ